MKINDTIILNDKEYKLVTTKRISDISIEAMLYDGENRWSDAVLIKDKNSITLKEESDLLGDDYEDE
jgi:hypothetical protein